MNGFRRKVIADVTNFSFDFIHYYHYSFISLLIPMDCKLVFIYVILIDNSRRKDKRNHGATTELVYVIQNPPDLHKLFVRFSQPKSFNIFRIFDECERLHAFGSHVIYNIPDRVVSDIQSLAFGSSLYIRYNTAAYIVNGTYYPYLIVL